jgi:Cu/Ag efflux pump CusA
MLKAVLTAALRFRMLAAALAGGLIALGILALPKMHADVLPELSQGPVLEVQTESPGLSSQEVEQYVTVPMENNLLDGVMGVWDVRSQSTPGLSTVDLYFQPGTTTLHARQLVEERLTNSFSLPAVNKPPLLIQPLSTTSRALMIGLSSSTMDPLELSYLARWVVKPRLSGIPGVANVAIFGQQDRQIQVQVDPSKLASHHVTLQQVIDTAGNAQLVSPLTYLEGSAPGTGGFIDGPNQRIDIRPVLPLGAPKDLATVPITDAPGRPTLGDVANVVESHQPLVGNALTSRGPGLVLLVQKLPSASVPGVTRGVERALDELRPALAGVSIDTSFFKPAAYVTGALHNLELALAIAAALGALALAALLLDARALLLTSLSVGLSLLAAVIVLDALGNTLNSLVVLGLLAACAVIVDDAVGDTRELVTAVRRRAATGEPLPIQRVIVESFMHLRSALGYATLIGLLSIAPVFFSRGLSATYLHPFVLAFALALMCSTLVALTVTPAIGMLLFDRGQRGHAVELVPAIATRYERALKRVAATPAWGLACVCAIGVAGIVAVPFLHQPAPPRFVDRNIVVQWSGPPGAGLGEMDRVTSRVLADLRALPSVADAAATLGRAVGGDQIVDSNSGQIMLQIKQSADYDRALWAIRGVVGTVPGMRASVSTYESDVQSGVLAPASHDLTVRLYGEDYAQLQSLGSQVEGLMAHVNGLGQAQMQLPTTEPNVNVAINDTAAHKAGVLPGDARRQASTLVSGLTVGNFFQQQAVFDVVVWSIPSVRGSLGAMRQLPIDVAGGRRVPLSEIAGLSVAPAAKDIQHEALSRYVDISAPVYVGGIPAAQRAIRGKLGQISFPLGYHAEVVGGTPRNPTSHPKFLTFALAALLGILLLLQAAFASWRLAAAFLLALPLALIGGLIVAVATGQASSLGADAGLLGTFVFAARAGIVQVTHVRRLHALDGGVLTAELVVRAGRERLCSALTTLVVCAVALVPFIAMGDVAGNEIAHVTAAVLLGGLVTATALSQMLIPALCLAFGPTGAMPAEDEDLFEAPALATSPSPS